MADANAVLAASAFRAPDGHAPVQALVRVVLATFGRGLPEANRFFVGALILALRQAHSVDAIPARGALAAPTAATVRATFLIRTFREAAVGDTSIRSLRDVFTLADAVAVTTEPAIHRAVAVGFISLTLTVPAVCGTVLGAFLRALTRLTGAVAAGVRLAVLEAIHRVFTRVAGTVPTCELAAVLLARLGPFPALPAFTHPVAAGAAAVHRAQLRPFPRVARAVAALSAIGGAGLELLVPGFAAQLELTLPVSANATIRLAEPCTGHALPARLVAKSVPALVLTAHYFGLACVDSPYFRRVRLLHRPAGPAAGSGEERGGEHCCQCATEGSSSFTSSHLGHPFPIVVVFLRFDSTRARNKDKE